MSKSIPLVLGCVILLGAHASAQITGKTNVGSFGPPPPNLELTVSFTEPSGDGLLNAGEVGAIRLTIQNIGDVPAKNLSAMMSATPEPKGVSFRPGSIVRDQRMSRALDQLGYGVRPIITVGDLSPKASQSVAFEVSASETVPAQTFTVTIEVSGDEGVSISERISIATKERVVVDTTPPEIILKKPAELIARGMRVVPSEIKTTSSSFAIEGIARDTSGVASVLINGAEAQVTQTEYSAEFSYTSSLRLGENRIEITALDRFKNESKLTFVVRREETLIAGQNQALLFAINSYDSWPRLTNPVFDARAIAEELRRNYGFSVEVIEDATQDQILSTLRRYAAKRYGENDQLFIFFAGHGQFDEVLGDGYLVAKDSKLNDDIKTSYVSHSNLRTIVNNIPCKHIFLVVDACFGGTFDPLIAANLRGEDEYAEVTRTEFIQRKMRFRTRRFLTSGGKEYVPDGRPGQHSPFVRRLLEAFRSYGGRDGILTINEILQYVEKVRPEPRAGEFGTNEPGSDFIFVAR